MIDDDIERAWCAGFAWHVLDRADPARLETVLVEQLEILLRGRGRGDADRRRTNMFAGILILQRAGLPIAITPLVGHA